MERRGEHVSIEPLRMEHAAELWPAADDDAMRRWWPRRWMSQEDVEAQFQTLLDMQATGRAEPFLLRAPDGTAAGSSAYYGLSDVHRHLTIGWTFLTPAHRRTAMNTEAKLLLLEEAFEVRGMERVQFDVDARNTTSRAAVLRLGATQEGILRRHRVLWDGFVRDTVVFSVLRDEWPRVKAGLRSRLAAT